jgi:hypothetical protein
MLSPRIRALLLLAVTSSLLAGGAVGVQAGPRLLRLNVDVGTAGNLSPDRRSVMAGVLARCPVGWTLAQTSVTFSQGQASGAASFPLTCTDEYQSFHVTIQSTGALFQLGDAQGSASVTVTRGGKTERVNDRHAAGLEPTAVAELADTALLASGGRAVKIAVTVACTPGPTGVESFVNVSHQGQVSGNGSYVPVCDGERHTVSVTVQAYQGVYQRGPARALTFATADWNGVGVYGIDDQPIQIVQS